MGITLNIIGYALTAKEIASWGLPSYLWYGIGNLIFIMSVGFIVWGFYINNKVLHKTIQTYQANDPLIYEAKKEHFKELLQLVRDWKDNLVSETNDFFHDYEVRFQTCFTAEDWQLNTPHQMGINWFIDQSGNLAVWFPVEDNTLFPRLREHLAGDEIWELFTELKDRITERIRKAPSIQKGHIMAHSQEIRSLTYRIADKLNIILTRGNYFSGKCQSCPDYQSHKGTK